MLTLLILTYIGV